ncbi:MAG: molybdopterin cofactor-binding domain-containing protein [Syntrophorhabdales bacterium]|jgi:4-hydroxybenzoyl-CoA reductase subunit alpha
MNRYTVINPHSKFTVINTHVHNVDGIAKVTGRATYTFDVVLPGMLYGKILRSPHPHAKIKGIDYSKAMALPGVKAVATGNDTIGAKQGIWRRYKDLCDEQLLTIDKVRYIGEPVAAVAAVTEEIAEKALELIDVDYEVLPATYEPLDAIKKDAPEIHEGFERNINVTRHIEWGDVDEGFAEADYIREDWFRCGGQAHMCMETRAAVSSYTPDGKLTIYHSNQSPYYMQGLMAGVMGMREGDIRVISPYVGGGFGGKFELDGAIFATAVLSKKCMKPVKIVFTREEDFIASKRRTPMFYYTRTGVKKDGTFLCREAKVFTNGGAYTGMGATALYLTGFFHSFPYVWQKGYRYDGYRVYTNTLPSTSMRGFGAPQAMWCSEQQIEWIAADLKLDPIEMRRKNSHYEGYEVPGQATIASCGINQCYDEIRKWIDSKGKLPKGHAIGLSACGFMSGGIFNWFDTPYSFSSAVITINQDGTVELNVGAQDIGQGSNTTMAIICAETLGCKLEDVKVHSGDTDYNPADLGAWGSRQTLMSGNAVKRAAEDAKKQLLEFAYAHSGLNIIYDLDIKDRWVHSVSRPERGWPYEEIVRKALRGKGGQRIMGRGFYTPYRKGMISPAYSYMLQGVEVEVDEETGKIKLCDSMTAHDCGQPINHLGLIGQLEGAFSMAAGYGYLEYMPYEDGKLMNPNLVDYKMIRAPEMPPANIAEIDTYEPEGPYGAKEAGEGLTNPTAAAIGNALFKLFGIQIKECPIRPEMVVNALKEKKAKTGK